MAAKKLYFLALEDFEEEELSKEFLQTMLFKF